MVRYRELPICLGGSFYISTLYLLRIHVCLEQAKAYRSLLFSAARLDCLYCRITKSHSPSPPSDTPVQYTRVFRFGSTLIQQKDPPFMFSESCYIHHINLCSIEHYIQHNWLLGFYKHTVRTTRWYFSAFTHRLLLGLDIHLSNILLTSLLQPGTS